MNALSIVRNAVVPVCLTIWTLTASGREAAAGTVGYDVLVTSLSGTLVTGGYDHADSSAFVPLRIFKGDALGVGPDDPYLSEEAPGFEASSQATLDGPAMTPSDVYAALPASRALTFAFRPITIGASTRNLFFWDGTGAVGFAPLTAAESLALIRSGFGGWTRTITGTSAGVVNGATIETTNAAGEIHKHLTTAIASGGAGPATGFYLFALQFQMSGLTPSLDSYFVYGAYDTLEPPNLIAFENAHDAALDWVDANLVAVPEPTSGLLAVAAAIGLVFPRRWRRRAADVAAAGCGH